MDEELQKNGLPVVDIAKAIRLHNWRDECGSEDNRWSQEFREDRSFS